MVPVDGGRFGTGHAIGVAERKVRGTPGGIEFLVEDGDAALHGLACDGIGRGVYLGVDGLARDGFDHGGIAFHFEAAVTVVIEGNKNGQGIGRYRGSPIAFAAPGGVAVDHLDDVPRIQAAFRDHDTDHEDVPLIAAIETLLGVFDEFVVPLTFHDTTECGLTLGKVGGDVVVLFWILGLEAHGGVAGSRMPLVGKLDPDAAACGDTAFTDRVGDGPGAIFTGNALLG